jgi:transposase
VSFSSAAAGEIASKHFIGTARGFWLLYKRFENGKLAWPNNEDEVRELSDEQVMRLMQGFTIDPKINTARAREFY